MCTVAVAGGEPSPELSPMAEISARSVSYSLAVSQILQDLTETYVVHPAGALVGHTRLRCPRGGSLRLAPILRAICTN